LVHGAVVVQAHLTVVRFTKHQISRSIN